ncbi:MAG: hypothetical protein HYV16_10420 [Gammaproteobacteria bacterium]|nr:hypothetical protein [Gammaproteobacteria bacterium]
MHAPQLNESLKLVKSELDLLLRHAERQLAEFTNYLENRDAWEQAAASLRQTAGVLEVIALPGALELARALSQAAHALEQADAEITAGMLPALVTGMSLLIRYLEQDRQHPALLLPAINALRAALGQAALPEYRFFDIDPRLPRFERGFVMAPDARRLPWQARRLRHMYQLGLLAVLRQENVSHGFFLLRRALNQLEGLCGESLFADFCRLAGAGVEALSEGKLQLARERRLVLGQVDRQLKRLVQPPLDLEAPAPESLVHQLLYWIALAEPATPLLQALKTETGLGQHISDGLLNMERGMLEDAGASVLPAARRELKLELGKLIAELDALSQNPEHVQAHPQRLENQLHMLAQTLNMLEMAEDGKRLRLAAERVHAEGERITGEQLLALAVELMDVDARLSAQLGLDLTVEAAPAALSPQAQASQDAHRLLGTIQEALTRYIADDWNTEHLAEVPAKLDTLCQGLQFLNAERAAVVLHTCAEFIRDRLLASATPPSHSQALEVLADAIICIDYYLDGLAGNQGLRQGVIELAEESADALLRLTRAA